MPAGTRVRGDSSTSEIPTNIKSREYRSLSDIKVKQGRIVPRTDDLVWPIRNKPHRAADLVNASQSAEKGN